MHWVEVQIITPALDFMLAPRLLQFYRKEFTPPLQAKIWILEYEAWTISDFFYLIK